MNQTAQTAVSQPRPALPCTANTLVSATCGSLQHVTHLTCTHQLITLPIHQLLQPLSLHLQVSNLTMQLFDTALLQPTHIMHLLHLPIIATSNTLRNNITLFSSLQVYCQFLVGFLQLFNFFHQLFSGRPFNALQYFTL